MRRGDEVTTPASVRPRVILVEKAYRLGIKGDRHNAAPVSSPDRRDLVDPEPDERYVGCRVYIYVCVCVVV